ncbi:receptor-like protein kinase HERK 1 [Solanum stenotomum]|uniref:receptor-like protein kinase HERK 1 n=1 Tax=Solanum stenotomum TaxID=172797 RepID=UPI0020D1DE1B|nr:receptor-like protein kinase HERK 1 [Solanum stenotomum]
MGSKYSKATTSINDDTTYGVPIESFLIPFVDLEEATNNFDVKFLIGECGFGKVCRGVLCDGTKVALKTYNPMSEQGIVEFQTEIGMLFRLRHPYLVSLVGYCKERDEMILVYEYMENGNLKSHLYGTDLPTMSWEQRLEICIGIARGLQYLHTNAVIHCDVKSTNILLDENFVPKITDLGLSKTGPDLDQDQISILMKGTMGYLDPEYFNRGQLTEKSDVYSFGVVLFEVLCARPAIVQTPPSGMISLAEWVVESQKKGQLEQIIDPNLVAKIRPESLRMFGETAVKCLALSGEDRPSMGDVLWKLEYALCLQESVIQHDPDCKSMISVI